MRLLFVCENPHEVASLVPVARELQALLGEELQFEFASLDNYHFQGTDEALEAAGVPHFRVPAPWPLERPLPEYGTAAVVRILLAAHRQVGRLAGNYDAVFIGVDVMAARMVVMEARAQGKPTFQLVNHWLFPREDPQRRGPRMLVRTILRKTLAYLFRARFLLPGEGPHQCGYDRMFVIGDQTREALARVGIVDDVVVTGAPRFAGLVGASREAARVVSPAGALTILYLPGSWAWHGHLAQHERQQAQLRQLTEWLQAQPEGYYRLLLKNHPREKAEYYDWLADYPVAEVLDAEVSLNDLWGRVDLMGCMSSMAIVEAISHGCPAVSLDFPADPDNPPPLREMGGLWLPLIDDFAPFTELLEKLRSNPRERVALAESERQGLEVVLSPRTADSARLIAEEVLAVLRSHRRC